MNEEEEKKLLEQDFKLINDNLEMINIIKHKEVMDFLK